MNLTPRIRILLGIVALVISFALVPTVAMLTSKGIYFLRDGISNALISLTAPGPAGLQGLIRLCLYLLVITLFVRFLTRR